MTKTLKPFAAALVAAVLLAGCGGGDDGNGDRSASSDGGDTEVEDLTALTIQLDDLPTGWAENNQEDDGNDDDTLGCLEEFDQTAENATGRGEASFVQGATVPQLEQVLAGFASEADAQAGFALVDELLDGCGEFETTSDDGQEITGQLGKVSLPDVPGAGEQANYQLTVTSEGFNFTAGIVVLRAGEHVTLLYLIDLGTFDADQLVDLATTAVDKL